VDCDQTDKGLASDGPIVPDPIQRLGSAEAGDGATEFRQSIDRLIPTTEVPLWDAIGLVLGCRVEVRVSSVPLKPAIEIGREGAGMRKLWGRFPVRAVA